MSSVREWGEVERPRRTRIPHKASRSQTQGSGPPDRPSRGGGPDAVDGKVGNLVGGPLASSAAPARTLQTVREVERRRPDENNICEILEQRLYFATLRNPEKYVESRRQRSGSIYFCVDKQLIYEPYSSDFGPLNLACLMRFCDILAAHLREGDATDRRVVFCTSQHPQKKANAAVLIGAYCILVLKDRPEEAYGKIALLEPFLPFRDASSGSCSYHITVFDCLQAVTKAVSVGFVDPQAFDVQEFERLEEADMTWMVPGRIIAFSTPAQDADSENGYLAPEDYLEYFKMANVSTIIRLNKKVYNKKRFTSHGFVFHDLYFPDGSAPPDSVVKKFFNILETQRGAVAIHCKAGLGRTGVLIGCYLMKHFGFSANEALGYMRMARPGSVIGQQQHYLRKIQPRMWKAGDEYREWLMIEASNTGARPTGIPQAFSAGFLSDVQQSDTDSFAVETDTESNATGTTDSSHMPLHRSNALDSFPRPSNSTIRVSSPASAAAAVAELYFQKDASDSDASVRRKDRRRRDTASPASSTSSSPRRRHNFSFTFSKDGRESSDGESMGSLKSGSLRGKPILQIQRIESNSSVQDGPKPDPNLAPRRGPLNQEASECHVVGDRKQSVFVRMINSVGQPRKVVLPPSTLDPASADAHRRRQLEEDGTEVPGCRGCVQLPRFSAFDRVQGGRFRIAVKS